MSETPRCDAIQFSSNPAEYIELAHDLERRLMRVAELSENMARRLAKRGWNAAEKTQHAADLAERDVILIAVRPTYEGCIALRDDPRESANG